MQFHKPKRLLVTATAIAAAMALAFPLLFRMEQPAPALSYIEFFGTAALVDLLTSTGFAEAHLTVVFLLAPAASALVFAIIAYPTWWIISRKAPRAGVVTILCWLALYGFLLLLFPRAAPAL
jgi:hypothetical protein